MVMAAVFYCMRIFMVRSVQEKYRQSADVFGEGSQYAKGVTKATDTSQSSGPVIPPVITPSTCPEIVSAVQDLESQRDSLSSQAADLETTADNIEAQIPELEKLPAIYRAKAAEYASKASAKEAEAQQKRNEATGYRTDAQAKQVIVDANKSDYPYCFNPSSPYYWSSPCYSQSCGEWGCYDTGVRPDTESLESAIAQLIADAEALEAEATKLENEAKDLRAEEAKWNKNAEDTEKQIQGMKDWINSLREQAVTLRASADAKQAQIDQYKTSHPECFS
jgi:predicted  nucleic acid-binding Zn-ribbon protein